MSGTDIELKSLTSPRKKSRYQRLTASHDSDTDEPVESADSVQPPPMSQDHRHYGAMRAQPRKDMFIVLWFRQLWILTRANFTLTVSATTTNTTTTPAIVGVDFCKEKKGPLNQDAAGFELPGRRQESGFLSNTVE